MQELTRNDIEQYAERLLENAQLAEQEPGKSDLSSPLIFEEIYDALEMKPSIIRWFGKRWLNEMDLALHFKRTTQFKLYARLLGRCFKALPHRLN